MSIMEQKMDHQIEAGIHERESCYNRISELESQLKEAKDLLKNANPIWKENCAKWAHWYKRLKELI